MDTDIIIPTRFVFRRVAFCVVASSAVAAATGTFLMLSGCDRTSPTTTPTESAAASQPAPDPSGSAEADAIARLSAAIRAQPSELGPYIERGRLYAQRALREDGLQELGALASALADFRRADSLAGGHWDCAFTLHNPIGFDPQKPDEPAPEATSRSVGGGSAEARLEAAKLARRLDRPDYAHALLESAEALRADDLETRVERIVADAAMRGDWKQATEELDRMTADAAVGKHACVWFGLGLTYQASGDQMEAKEAYAHALRLDPGQAECRAALDQMEAKARKREDAATARSGVLPVESQYVFATDTYASKLRNAGRTDEALTIMLHLMQRYPGFPLGWLNLGRAYRAVGDTESAIASFRAYSTILPSTPDGQREIGETYYELGQFERAATEYEAALTHDPKSPYILRDYGDAKRRAGQIRESELAYKQATKSMPSFAPAWQGLALALLDQHRTDEARSAVRETLRFAPKYPDTYWKLDEATPKARGEVLPEAFLSLVRDVLQKDEDVLNDLCSRLYLDQRFADVIALSAKILAANPACRAALLWHATGCEAADEFDAAVHDWDRAIEIQPDGMAFECRALAKLIGGRPREQVLADLNAALEREPGRMFSSLLTWILEREANQQDAAQAAVSKALDSGKADEWHRCLLQYYRGDLTQDALLGKAKPGGELCEAYYYIAEKVRIEQGMDAARPLFKRSEAQNVRTYVEHRLARWRLKRPS